MSSETSLTGHNGIFVVDEEVIARGTGWTVNPTLATKSEWGDSDSAGWTNRAAGRRDATFTAEGKYDVDTEVFDVFMPGDILEAFLVLDHTVIAGLYFAFPRALCDDFSLMVDMNTMEVIGWTSKWGADGKMYWPGEESPSVLSPSLTIDLTNNRPVNV